MRKGLLPLLLLLSLPAWAQPGVRVAGRFLDDSLRLGLPVRYVLQATYPDSLAVLFPDSSVNLGSFEWQGRHYFPTVTRNGRSRDSVVYTLVSFQLDSLAVLSLPVFVVRGTDSVRVTASPDTLLFARRVLGPAGGQPLRSITVLQPVPPETSLLAPALITGAGLVVLGLLWLLFGRSLRRFYRLYRMRLQHGVYLAGYERLRRRLRGENSVETVENAVVLWKTYMESLEEKPFRTYTTKEILELIPDERLAEALKDTDKTIYGQVLSPDVDQSLVVLEEVSIAGYHRKRESLRQSQNSPANKSEKPV